MSTWNDLSIREKAGFIKIGVDNGLTSLSDIQGAYNKFAQGGVLGNKQVRKFSGEEGDNPTQQMHTNTSSANVDSEISISPELREKIRRAITQMGAYAEDYQTMRALPWGLNVVTAGLENLTGLDKAVASNRLNQYLNAKQNGSPLYVNSPRWYKQYTRAHFPGYSTSYYLSNEDLKQIAPFEGYTYLGDANAEENKPYTNMIRSAVSNAKINRQAHISTSPYGVFGSVREAAGKIPLFMRGQPDSYSPEEMSNMITLNDAPIYGMSTFNDSENSLHNMLSSDKRLEDANNFPAKFLVGPHNELLMLSTDLNDYGGKSTYNWVSDFLNKPPYNTSVFTTGYAPIRADYGNGDPLTVQGFLDYVANNKEQIENPDYELAVPTNSRQYSYDVLSDVLNKFVNQDPNNQFVLTPTDSGQSYVPAELENFYITPNTKALGGHIYDGKTEDNQQMSTINPPQGYISKIGDEYTIRDDVDLSNYIELLKNESFEGAKSDIAALRDIINRRHTPETFGISANSIYGPILSNMDKGERDRITQSYLNSALNMLRYGSIFDPQWEDQWWMLKDLKDDPRYDAATPWLYHGLPQATYLMSPQDQYTLFMDQGWKYLGKGQYNLVKNAAKRHKKYGKEGLPTYQIKEDAYDRNDVMPITNIYDSESGRQISEILPKDAQLPDPGFYPGTLYYNGATGNFAVKGEDLNDYGGNFGMLAPFTDLGNELDKEGSPVVVTTGIQPAVDKGGNPITLDTLLNNQDNPYYAGYLQSFDDALAKQGIHTEYIDGYRYFMSPGFTVTPNGVTPNGYAWGGNLYKDGGSENNSSGGGGGIPLYLPEDTGNKTLDKVMKVANIVGDFVPVLGSARSIQTAVQDPSLANIGSAILSVAGDVSGFGLISKAVKGIRMAKNAQRLKEATMTYNHAEDAAALQREITKTLGRSKVNRLRQKALNRARNQARTNMDKARAVVEKGVKTPNVRVTERITAGTNTVKTGVQDVKKL